MRSKSPNIKLILSLIAVFLSVSVPKSSATDVSGDVWGEWTAAGNPYNVVGDLRVPPGSTLVIGPGCYIEFQGYYQFLVDASAILQAIGTESDSIIFTTFDPSILWDGLLFSYADSVSQLRYCMFERGHGIDHSDGGAVQSNNSYLEIRNCLFQNNHAWGSAIHLLNDYFVIIENSQFNANRGHSAIHTTSCSHIEILYNLFTNNDSMTVMDSYNEPDAARIADNEFRDNHYSALIEVGGSGTIVEDNIIYNNIGNVFYCWMISWQSIFRRNIIYNNYCPWYYCGGIFVSEDSHYLVENNTICNNSGVYGSYLANIFEEHSTNSPVDFKNNIIWGNSFRNPEDSLFLLTDVIFTQIYSDIQGGWSGIGNIMADPLFVDTANGDFHLMPGSPCIDAGDPASPLDPDSTRADMGALYFDQTTGIKLPPRLPRDIALYQNYPNPFNAGTIIKFDVMYEGRVSINIYDLLGRRVSSIVDAYYLPGTHEIPWNGLSQSGKQLPTGVYLYKLKSDTFEQTRKMMLLK